jgi:hypothetical protein
MNNTQTKHIFYIVLFVYVIAGIGIVGFNLNNATWDPALTLKMTDNGYKNIPFNQYAHPAPANLDKDETEFVTWWSPGQFALPLLIEKCFKVNLSLALKILTIICLTMSGFGIFKLYHKLIAGKTAVPKERYVLIALGFLLFTLIQPFFFINLFIYDGGGILMLAYCPWFIYWVVTHGSVKIHNLLFLLILSLIGFFLKTAFTSIFAGALFYLLIQNLPSAKLPDTKIVLKKIFPCIIYLAITFVIYVAITKILFLDHNTNISNSSNGIRVQPRVIFFPVVAPLLGLLGLGGLNKTIYWIISSAFIVPAYYCMVKSDNISLLYKRTLVGFTLVCMAFYALLYFINIDVSYEFRHYTIITILLTPAFFITFKQGRLSSYLVFGFMAIYTAFNIINYTKTIVASNKDKSTVGYYSGLALPYPADLISKIHSLDGLNKAGRDIFYFKSDNPTAALEIRHNRVLLEDNYLNFHFVTAGRLQPVLYYGRNSGEIYVVYPLDHFKSDSVKYLTRFDLYKKFDEIYRTGGYVILKAIPSDR